MNSWNRFWFGDVPQVRCQLLITTLSLMVAFDCWLNFLPHAALHGMTDFHVAHLAVLDKMPFAPSAQLYAALQISVGLLLLCGLWSPSRRWLHLTACGLYSWGWMMSQLDSFQHHYFLSFALLCTAWLEPQSAHRHPYKLLGVIVAVLYFFTAIAKMEPIWTSGIVLRSLGENYSWPDRIIELLRFQGIAPASAWSLLAVGVIVAELLLAIGYLGATVWPQPIRRSAQCAFCGFLTFALITHLSIEAFQLKIGWFSYYMMVLAVVFFTPVRWLEAITPRVTPHLKRKPVLRNVVGATFAGVLLLATCVFSPTLVEYRLLRAGAWLEKGQPQIALETLNHLSAFDAYQSEDRKIRLQQVRLAAYRGLGDTKRAAQTSSLLTARPSLPAQVRLELAAQALDTQDLAEAIAQLAALLDENPHHMQAKSQLGLLYLQRGQLAQAEEQLRQVLDRRPFHHAANYDLGVLLVLSDRAAEAALHLQRVLDLQPEHGQARYYLAISHDLAGNLEEARREYIRALSYLPQLHDARLNLAKLMLEQGQNAAALQQLHQIPPDATCYQEAKALISEQPSPQ